jgi:hypothetical protein
MKPQPSIGRTDFDARFAGLLGMLVAALFGSAGCCDECDQPILVDYPPAAPTGVFSVTGDERVDIYWNANTEPDLAGYDIFWSPTSDAQDFEYMVSTRRDEAQYADFDVDNGITYFYMVRAYDRAGNVSDFSDVIFDTPRPAGTGLVLHDYLGQNAGSSGYDFSAFAVQAWNISTTDVYFGLPSGIPTLFGRGSDVGDGVDVQDYGFVDLDFVDWAPEILDGWSPSKRVEMIPGHSYVVQILGADDYYYYAKLFCQSQSGDLVVLNWAYQEDPGNPELSPGRGGKR